MPPDGSKDTPLLFVVTGTLVFILSADISQYVPVVDIRGRCLLLAVKMCLSVLLQKNVVRRVGRAETERLNRWILHDIRMPVRFLYQQ